MIDDPGDFLTRWTIRLSMALYVLALSLRCHARGRAGRLSAARLAWTAGCALFLAHVGCAFTYFYDWSHVTAYAETVRRTEEMAGVAWGGGLYLNYAFTVIWLVDVLWWWLGPASYQRRGLAAEWLVQGFMGFIAFNGAIVFADWPMRVAGIVACAALFLACRASRAG